jgi:branched-chain amino acid transport system permease protein
MAGGSKMEALIGQMVANALMLAGFYVLVASGLTLLLGSIKILTLAQGAMCMLGGYGLYYFLEELGLPYGLSVFLSVIIVGLIGVACDKFLLRKYRQKFLIVSNLTLGVWLISETGVALVFGSLDKTVTPMVHGLLRLGEVVVPWERFLMVISAAILTGLLFAFLFYTKQGRAIRAYGFNAVAAELQGIRPDRIAAIAMFIATGYAAIAGVLAAPIFTINPHSGYTYLMRSVTVILLGGLGSIPGCVLAGLIIGAIDSFIGTLAGTTIASIVGFVFIMLLIIMRPAGLLGVEYELYFE